MPSRTWSRLAQRPTRLALAAVPLAVALSATPDGAGRVPASATSSVASTTAQDTVDELIRRVLARREESWRRLHQYVLDERETLDVRGPGGTRPFGFRREFTWYIRDGYLIRSPVRFDGAAADEPRRREYEAEWLREEQRRQARQDGQRQWPEAPDGAPAEPREPRGVNLEPRFVSEAYFFGLDYEPDTYYFAGREELAGRPVVRIEHYPSGDTIDGRSGATERDGPDRDEFERQFNKTTLVTMWIDQEADQIVKLTFDNVGLEFLPARWLVRIDELSASMTMGQPFAGVWLPDVIEIGGRVTAALGSFSLTYRREYDNYRQAEVSARIRAYREP